VYSIIFNAKNQNKYAQKDPAKKYKSTLVVNNIKDSKDFLFFWMMYLLPSPLD